MPSLTESDLRVRDYLDDRLQAKADLDTVDSLLQTVRSQHGLLRKQLEDALSDLNHARETSRGYAESMHTKSRQFDHDQHDIDRRMKIITASDASDDAVRRFEVSMSKLGQLDITVGYIELLKTVDSLHNECAAHLDNKSADGALQPYSRLHELLRSLGPLQEAAEGAAPHLVDHVSRTTENVRARIQGSLSDDLEALLTKLSWPKKDCTVPDDLRDEWSHRVGQLLELQKPELDAQEKDYARNRSSKDPKVLLPLQVMAKPLEMAFRYHFEGDRRTNRPEKPELFLDHVQKLLGNHYDFMLDHLQPVLLKHFRGTGLAKNSIYIDATAAFITAVLPMVRNKVFALVPEVASEPQLLSHLMHELKSFDETIRDEWRYDGGYGADGWKGLTWEVLVQKDWFGRWLQVEKDFALTRYQTIIDTPDSGELDYDSVEPRATKPTKAAIRVHDLLDSVTDLYRPLTSFSQKLRFLIDIQISIFDRFHEWLHSSLEAYLSMTSSLGRTVQGVSKEEQAKLQGVNGLERLCRVYGSADFLERAMRNWGDDVFFLDLYTELETRATAPSSNKPLAGPLTIEHIASRTSAALDPASTSVDDLSGADTGALFDETATAYDRLRSRCESIIIEQLTTGASSALRPYRASNPWASLTVSGSTGSTSASPSPDLGPLLRTHLPSHLSFLTRALATTPLRRILRALALSLDALIFDGVLSRYAFSRAGAAQFSVDIAAIEAAFAKTVDTSSSGGETHSEPGTWLRKCTEGARLVSLDAQESTAEAEAGNEGDHADAAAWGEVDEEGTAAENGGLDLWAVEQRLFASNESARAVLADLDMGALTEAEARAVLGKRVELRR